MFVTTWQIKPLKTAQILTPTTPDWAVDNLWISLHYVFGTGLTETAERIPPE
jgi:hypothetical protein